MAEVAINAAWECTEIKKIILDELAKKLDGLSPLQGEKNYANFGCTFDVKIHLVRVGETTPPRETLAWGNVGRAPSDPNTSYSGQIEEKFVEEFQAGDPNTERMDRGLPLTVESNDGKGGKRTKKVVIRRPQKAAVGA